MSKYQDDQASAGSGAAMQKPRKLARTVVLVGLMGAGKSAVGRRLAARLGAAFRDADDEIETAAAMSIPEIFSKFGEPYFREGERRVIARLLTERPHVLATGGGAFMDPATRDAVQAGAVSVWLKAGLDTLVHRCGRREDRPLLQGKDIRAVLADLIETRYPTYAEADVTIESLDEPHERAVEKIIAGLEAAGAFEDGAAPAAAAPQASALGPLRHPPEESPKEPPMTVRTLTVELGDRAYPIEIGSGLLARAGAALSPYLSRPKVFVVTDETVAQHHLGALEAGLAASGVGMEAIAIPPGEASKSIAQLDALLSRLLDMKVERDDLIVAAWGRGDRRSRGVCGGHPAPRRAVRADPDDAAGAGRQLSGRQDRDQRASWQELDRRVSPTDDRSGGYRRS